jgi:hypothetical protein
MRSILLAMIFLLGLALPAGAEMYKWVDEKGTVHFTDDPSMIPEKNRRDTEKRKGTTEPPPKPKEKQLPPTVTNLLNLKGLKLSFREEIRSCMWRASSTGG